MHAATLGEGGTDAGEASALEGVPAPLDQEEREWQLEGAVPAGVGTIARWRMWLATGRRQIGLMAVQPSIAPMPWPNNTHNACLPPSGVPTGGWVNMLSKAKPYA